MTQWWNELSGNQQIFWAIALISTTLLLIQFALSILGADFDSDADVDGGDLDHSMDSDFTVFSIRGILAFFTFFGWGSVLMLGEGSSVTTAMLVGVVAGFVAMFIVAYMMFWFSKMTEVGNIDISAALLSRAEVYLTIPGKRSGEGKVHILIGNSLKEMDAVTEADTLPTGSHVRVLEILGDNVLLVEPLKQLDKEIQNLES